MGLYDSPNDQNVSTLYKRKVAGRAQKKVVEQENILNSFLDNPVEEPKAPTAGTAAPVAPPQDGFVKGTAKAVGGGVRDAIVEMSTALADGRNWLAEKAYDHNLDIPGLRSWANTSKEAVDGIVPAVGENTSVPGQLLRGITQFATGFYTGGRLLKGAQLGAAALAPAWATRAAAAVAAAPKTATVVGGLAKGAFADAFAFDPHQQRLSNLVNEAEVAGIPLANPVTTFLASKPGDTNAEGRLKNALEGMGLGVAAEGLFHGIKALRGRKNIPESTLKSFDDVLHGVEDEVEAAGHSGEGASVDLTDPSAVRKAKQQDVAARVLETEQLDARLSRAQDAAHAEHERASAYEMGISDDDIRGVSSELHELPESPSPAGYLHDDFIPSTGPHELRPEPPKAPVVPPKTGSLDVAHDLSYLSNVDHPKPNPFPKDTIDSILYEATDYRPKEVSGGVGEVADHPVISEGRRTARKTQQYLSEMEQRAAANPKTKLAGDAMDLSHLAVATHPERPLVDYARNLGHDSLDSFLSAIRNERGAASQAVQQHLVGASAGGAVGGTQKDENGNFSLKNVAIGMLGGAGLVSAGRFISKAMTGVAGAEKKTLPEAFKELTAEQVARLDATVEKAKAALTKLSEAPEGISPELKAKLEGHIETLTALRKQTAKITPESFMKEIHDPVAKEEFLKASKPLVTVDDAAIKNIQERVLAGEKVDISEGIGINFDHIETQDDIKNLLNVVGEEAKAFKPDVKSHEAIRASVADDLGMTVEDLNKTYKGTLNLDEHIWRGRLALQKSSQQLAEIAKSIISGDDSAAAVIKLRSQISIHTGIQKELASVRTEVGRALSSFKMLAREADTAGMEAIVAQMGGRSRNIDIAKKLLEAADNPRQLNQFARSVDRNKWTSSILEYWYNSLLSSPATWAVNVTTNAMTTVLAPLERFVAGSIDSMTGGSGQAIRQAKHMTYGALEGLKDSWRLAGDAFRTGEPILDPLTKLDAAQGHAISSVAYNLDEASMLGRFADFMGTAIRVPQRMLVTGDEFFKQMNYRMSFNEQIFKEAERQAVMDGLTGDAVSQAVPKYMQALKANTPEELLAEIRRNALDFARYQTFQTQLTPGMQGLATFVNKVPGARAVIPFLKTPTNIAKFVGKRTPVLNMAWETERAALFGADSVARSEALARMSTGGALYATGWYLASQGILTGGGPKDKSGNQLAGIQPYSVKLGDTYYAINRLDPFGMFLGLAADFHDISGQMDEEDVGELSTALVMAVGKNVTSKTYLQGVAKFIEMLDDPDRYGKDYVGNLLGSFAPSMGNTIAHTIDPVMRETTDLMDYFKKRIPGYSDTLPPKRNLFGEPITLAGGYGNDSMSPIYTSKETNDPVKKEMARLQLKTGAVLGGMKKIEGVELTPEQHDRFVVLMGEPLKASLDKLVASESYQAKSDGTEELIGGKGDAIMRKVRKYKERAKLQLLKEFPDLKATLQTNHQLVAAAKKPNGNDWLASQLQQ